jgi:hypothetical protein
MKLALAISLERELQRAGAASSAALAAALLRALADALPALAGPPDAPPAAARRAEPALHLCRKLAWPLSSSSDALHALPALARALAGLLARYDPAALLHAPPQVLQPPACPPPCGRRGSSAHTKDPRSAHKALQGLTRSRRPPPCAQALRVPCMALIILGHLAAGPEGGAAALGARGAARRAEGTAAGPLQDGSGPAPAPRASALLAALAAPALLARLLEFFDAAVALLAADAAPPAAAAGASGGAAVGGAAAGGKASSDGVREKHLQVPRRAPVPEAGPCLLF